MGLSTAPSWIIFASRDRRCVSAASRRIWVRERKSHSEQIWSALPPMADIDFSREDFSVGPKHEVAALQPAARGKSREAGSDGEDSDSGVATINSRIVGVIKNSRIVCGRGPSHTATRISPAYN